MRRQTAAGRRAIITLCSASRVGHLKNQLQALREIPDSQTIVVWIDKAPPPPLSADDVLPVAPGRFGMRLAAARNAGANHALERGAELLIFLDADCIPGNALVALYECAAAAHPGAILCGPVTYLPPDAARLDSQSLEMLTNPHAARPAPPTGQVLLATAGQYRLFWSLSFAITARAWRGTTGFHEAYEGYGAEDTDFAFSSRRAGMPLAWVGGAHAYHQHHPTTSPPWQHLDDILRNAALFADRWGQWPMTGWLEAFAAQGAIEFDSGTWRRRSSLTAS